MPKFKAILLDKEKLTQTSLNSYLKQYFIESDIILNEINFIEQTKEIDQLTPNDLLSNGLMDVVKHSKLPSLNESHLLLVFASEQEELNKDHTFFIFKASDRKVLQELAKRINARLDNSSPPDYVGICSKSSTRYVALKEIVYLQAGRNYTSFLLANGEELVASKHLGHYAPQFPCCQFFRCHQSYLVNLKYIQEILSADGYWVKLKNEEVLPLTRGRKEGLLAKLAENTIF
ncbi:MAG: LytTR family DNA-binding domain-containing protein [Bacteroidota bacterium]